MQEIIKGLNERIDELARERRGLERRFLLSIVEAMIEVDFPPPDLLQAWARTIRAHTRADLHGFAVDLDRVAVELERELERQALAVNRGEQW